MIRSFLAKAPRLIAFTLLLHVFAATGFTGTVPAMHRHRQASTYHKKTAYHKTAAHPTVHATAKTPVHRVAPVVSRTPRLRTVQAPKEAVAGPRPVAPAPGIIAGGPWTSPTYADSTDGDNIDGEDLDIRRAAVDSHKLG